MGGLLRGKVKFGLKRMSLAAKVVGLRKIRRGLRIQQRFGFGFDQWRVNIELPIRFVVRIRFGDRRIFRNRFNR
ncbi:MAG: hypothetical protein CBC48_12695 [bacterium TMED88]|nr:hypothetical protein [Deltaproteobacteria bacterium]OUV28720.1 MAG: hypothetical protein CBC48_12695 [bacterium TMED88]